MVGATGIEPVTDIVVRYKASYAGEENTAERWNPVIPPLAASRGPWSTDGQ